MISQASSFQLESHHGLIADAIINRMREATHSFSLNLTFSSASQTNPFSESVQILPAEFIFPTFSYSLPVVIESSRSAENQQLILKIQVSEGVDFVWQTANQPVDKAGKIIVEGTAGLSITSTTPSAHFIAATLQSLLILDELAVLQSEDGKLSANMHFVDSLGIASKFLQRRQMAYRLMVIEKAFNHTLPIPATPSDADRRNIDFIYRAVTDRSFIEPFWQDSFEFPATEQVRKLLSDLDGQHPFLFEIDCLQEVLLGQSIDLGQVNLNIQNCVLANPHEVAPELQQLNGHRFRAVIRSLSGSANYQFLDAPMLPVNAWNKVITEFIELEEKLDDKLFQGVNELAASTLSGLTPAEIAEVTQRFFLDGEAFADPEIS